jgi:hypothetical protein
MAPVFGRGDGGGLDGVLVVGFAGNVVETADQLGGLVLDEGQAGPLVQNLVRGKGEDQEAAVGDGGQ